MNRTICCMLLTGSLAAAQQSASSKTRSPAADTVSARTPVHAVGEPVTEVRQDQKNMTEVLLAVFTGLLVVVGALQWRTLTAQKGAMDKQEDRLRETIDHMRVATQLDLRAYMHATIASKEKVTIQNVGRTPAHEVRFWANIYHGPHSWWKGELERGPNESRAVLPPGGSFYIAFALPPLTAEENAQIASGDPVAVYVKGHIEYTDIFGEARMTDFCFDAVGEINVAKNTFTISKTGNGYT